MTDDPYDLEAEGTAPEPDEPLAVRRPGGSAGPEPRTSTPRTCSVGSPT